MRTSTAALIRRDDRLLFVRRPPGGDLGGCWELPGGKVDAGERPPEALRRELDEELGIAAVVREAVAEVSFFHDAEQFRLIGFEVEADLASLELREHVDSALLTAGEALLRRLAPSDASLLRTIAMREERRNGQTDRSP